MPADTTILTPVFALAGWTVCMLLYVAFRRVSSSLSARISPQEYALGESPKVPPAVQLANRNHKNLLELPLLFCVVCLMALVTGTASASVFGLAWGCVGLRVLHGLIHISYNQVMHRFAAFAASNVVLLLMWVQVGLALMRRGAVA